MAKKKGRKQTSDTRKKIGVKSVGWFSRMSVERQEAYREKKRIEGNSPERCAKVRATWERKLARKSWSQLGEMLKSRIVKREQKEACNRCERTIWLWHKITLEIHHKDGNNSNWARENLEAICPNCHSLTDTWRNKNNRVLKVRAARSIEQDTRLLSEESRFESGAAYQIEPPSSQAPLQNFSTQ